MFLFAAMLICLLAIALVVPWAIWRIVLICLGATRLLRP
jgi:hypothetical protein